MLPVFKIIASSCSRLTVATRRKLKTFNRRTVMRWLIDHEVQLAVFLVGFAVLALRRPDAILNAQFWAEDARWWSNAVGSNYSFEFFWTPYAGYLVMVQRLVAFLSGAFPLEFSPLVFNVAALSLQALVLVYLWSKRTGFITIPIKLALSVFYLCLPYTHEIHANLTNSQWILGLLLFLLILIRESNNPIIRAVDRFFIVLAGLSGPFSIILMPMVAIEAWRQRRIPLRYMLVAATALIQLTFLLFTRDTGHVDLGFSFTKLFSIIGGQLFGTGLYGTDKIEFFLHKPWITPVVAVLGLQALIYVFVKSNAAMRYFLFFGMAIFVSSLFSALSTTPGSTWWSYFTNQGFGSRYLFIPHLAVFAALTWLALTPARISILMRLVAAAVLISSLIIGIPSDFKHEPYEDFNYKQHIKEFKATPKGEVFYFPVNPGEIWQGVYKR